jgi:hypothetical protein
MLGDFSGFLPGIKLRQFTLPSKAYWPIPNKFETKKYSDKPDANVSAK